MLVVKWTSIHWRVQGVLEDLAKPGFPETQTDVPVVVDIDLDADDDINGGSGSWGQQAEREAVDEQEMDKVERIT